MQIAYFCRSTFKTQNRYRQSISIFDWYLLLSINIDYRFIDWLRLSVFPSPIHFGFLTYAPFAVYLLERRLGTALKVLFECNLLYTSAAQISIPWTPERSSWQLISLVSEGFFCLRCQGRDCEWQSRDQDRCEQRKKSRSRFACHNHSFFKKTEIPLARDAHFDHLSCFQFVLISYHLIESRADVIYFSPFSFLSFK